MNINDTIKKITINELKYIYPLYVNKSNDIIIMNKTLEDMNKFLSEIILNTYLNKSDDVEKLKVLTTNFIDDVIIYFLNNINIPMEHDYEEVLNKTNLAYDLLNKIEIQTKILSNNIPKNIEKIIELNNKRDILRIKLTADLKKYDEIIIKNDNWIKTVINELKKYKTINVDDENDKLKKNEELYKTHEIILEKNLKDFNKIKNILSEFVKYETILNSKIDRMKDDSDKNINATPIKSFFEYLGKIDSQTSDIDIINELTKFNNSDINNDIFKENNTDNTKFYEFKYKIEEYEKYLSLFKYKITTVLKNIENKSKIGTVYKSNQKNIQKCDELILIMNNIIKDKIQILNKISTNEFNIFDKIKDNIEIYIIKINEIKGVFADTSKEVKVYIEKEIDLFKLEIEIKQKIENLKKNLSLIAEIDTLFFDIENYKILINTENIKINQLMENVNISFINEKDVNIRLNNNNNEINFYSFYLNVIQYINNDISTIFVNYDPNRISKNLYLLNQMHVTDYKMNMIKNYYFNNNIKDSINLMDKILFELFKNYIENLQKKINEILIFIIKKKDEIITKRSSFIKEIIKIYDDIIKEKQELYIIFSIDKQTNDILETKKYSELLNIVENMKEININFIKQKTITKETNDTTKQTEIIKTKINILQTKYGKIGKIESILNEFVIELNKKKKLNEFNIKSNEFDLLQKFIENVYVTYTSCIFNYNNILNLLNILKESYYFFTGEIMDLNNKGTSYDTLNGDYDKIYLLGYKFGEIENEKLEEIKKFFITYIYLLNEKTLKLKSDIDKIEVSKWNDTYKEMEQNLIQYNKNFQLTVDIIKKKK